MVHETWTRVDKRLTLTKYDINIYLASYAAQPCMIIYMSTLIKHVRFLHVHGTWASSKGNKLNNWPGRVPWKTGTSCCCADTRGTGWETVLSLAPPRRKAWDCSLLCRARAVAFKAVRRWALLSNGALDVGWATRGKRLKSYHKGFYVYYS